MPYKVNIYAMVDDADSLNESKELHEKVRSIYPAIHTILKVIMLEGVLSVFSEDMERSGSAASGAQLISQENSNIQH